MKQLLVVFTMIYVLSLSSGIPAETIQKQNESNYFENYPASWSEIGRSKETVIVSNRRGKRIQVTISPQELQSNKATNKNNSRCKYDYCLSIAVDNETIIIPDSVFCSLNSLNRGKVFSVGNSSVLMLNGGDSSTSYYVRIEFNEERVLRRIVYADSSMQANQILQETIYHKVVD